MAEKYGNKVRRLIKEKGFNTLKDFYALLKDNNRKETIDRVTLTRVLSNKVDVREKTNLQLANALFITASSLREGTDQETQKKQDTNQEASFTYKDKKSSYKITEKNKYFVVEMVHLSKGGKSDVDQDDVKTKDSLKWAKVVTGKVNIVIMAPTGELKQTLKPSQGFSFDARLKHYYENISAKSSMLEVVHYPAENNTLASPF